MNYWDILAQAAHCLDEGRYAQAEQHFDEATGQRERSPGMVFLSEKVGDGWRRFWGSLRSQPQEPERQAGRWTGAVSAFRERFRELGEATVADAARRAELQPDGAGPAELDTAIAALFLLTRSRLYPDDLTTAVPILKAAVQTAVRSGRFFPLEIIRHDLPLTEGDRLWLADRGRVLLEQVGRTATGLEIQTRQREGTAGLIALLRKTFFGAGSPLLAERQWIEAELADRFLGEPDTTVRLYREYLQYFADSRLRGAMARLRLLELLANLDAQHFAAPRHQEAQAEAARWTDPGADPAAAKVAARYREVAQALSWRRPRSAVQLGWASVAPAGDGRLAFVFWWGSDPRDIAFWRPGEDSHQLLEFLAPCRGAVVCADEHVASSFSGQTDPTLAGWSVRPFAEALLEAQLPAEGWTPAAIQQLALSQSAAWRNGWNRTQGHPLLRPPRRIQVSPAAERGGADLEDAESDGPDNPGLEPVLSCGLLWLACLHRLREADPALLEGLLDLAAGGDAAAKFLSSFPGLGLDFPGGPGRQSRAGAGTLPALSLRPSPLVGMTGTLASISDASGPRPDLAGNEVAIVTTGQPASVMAAWGAPYRHWRVVLDRADRLPVIAAALTGVGGLSTMLPAGGGVHDLKAAMAFSDHLLAAASAAGSSPGNPGYRAVLPLLHRLRLVETHNGDLLDYQAVRPRSPGVLPLHDLYAEAVAELPRLDPSQQGGNETGWVGEYRERVRRSRVAVGRASQLSGEADRLDGLWGVQEGVQAAWIFLDSAAVHWQLWQRQEADELAALHRLLAGRGRRHLSLVLGGTFLREDLEQQLSGWLEPYGTAYCLALADARPGCLHLAVGGTDPTAHVLVESAVMGQWEHLANLVSQAEHPFVLLPENSRLASLWSDLAAGGWGDPAWIKTLRFIKGADVWREAQWREDRRHGRLVVPLLTSLAAESSAATMAPDMAAWQAADQQRSARLEGERRLCSLEINALLACGFAAVDIADTRWWRRFPLPVPPAADGERNARRAAAMATARDSGRPYDLPEDGGSDSGRAKRQRGLRDSERLRERLRSWLRARDWIDDSGLGCPPGCLGLEIVQSSPDEESQAVRLHVGAVETVWPRLAVRLAEHLERGRLDTWLLIVGDRPPAGAGAFLDVFPAVGATVWPPVESLGASGPAADAGTSFGRILWIRPEAFSDANLARELARRPPTMIYGGDIRLWLPTGARPRLATAAALRHLTLSEGSRVDLFASSLPVAWENVLRRYWAEEVGARGVVLARAPELPAGAEGEGEPLVAGRISAPPETCPHCGTHVRVQRDEIGCPNCGLDLAVWRGEATLADQRKSLLRQKLVALLKRTDLGRERPLRLWLHPADWELAAGVLQDLGLVCRRRGEVLLADPDPERSWLLSVSDGAPLAPEDGPHALLLPPAADLFGGKAGWPGPGSVSLWLHARDLVACGPVDARQAAERFSRMLKELPQRLPLRHPPRPAGSLARELVPLKLLQDWADLSAEQLQWGLNAVRWLAVLAGDVAWPVDAERPPGSDYQTLHPDLAFAEIEHQVRRMREALELLLPLILASTGPGVLTYCDLAALPARISPEVIAWLDQFLLANSLRLGQPAILLAAKEGTAESPPVGWEGEFLYAPAAGLLSSTRRRLGYLGTVSEVSVRLRHHLDMFLASVQVLLAAAETTPEGFRIVLGEDIQPLFDADVVELGYRLGFWRRTGRARTDQWPLAELLVLAQSSIVQQARVPPRLLRELLQEQDHWADHLSRCLPLGLIERPADRQAQPAATTAAGRTIAAKTTGRIVDHVMSLEARQLILNGWSGSGRLAAFLSGLHGAHARGFSWHRLAVFCPDTATAARVHVAWRREFPHWQPPLALPEESHLPSTGEAPHRSDWQAAAMVTVMMEAQRFAAEQRYRLAHYGRQGPLIMMVDPGEMEESWEHLFLVTPHADDVIVFPEQQLLAKKIWQIVSELAVNQPPGRLRSRRRRKGECRALWAANLDECLAHILSAGLVKGPDRAISLVAPQPEDLAYVGRSLHRQGWWPVYRQELDELLLPGPWEFLAAVTDQILNCAARFPDSEADKALAAADPVLYEHKEISLLAPLLAGPAMLAYDAWRNQQSAASLICLRDFYESICRTRWGADFLIQPAARGRVEKLVADFGNEMPTRFLQRSLWQAWRRETAAAMGLPSPSLERPLVTLATPAVGGGMMAATGVYLCLGHEARRQHYQVLSRIADDALVLYQDSSPLPGDAPGDSV
jgi:hypothetical protein